MNQSTNSPQTSSKGNKPPVYRPNVTEGTNPPTDSSQTKGPPDVPPPPTDSSQTKRPPDVPTHHRTVHKRHPKEPIHQWTFYRPNVPRRNPPTDAYRPDVAEGSLTFCFFDLTLAGMTVEPVCSMAASELKTRVDSVDRLSPIREGRPGEQKTTTLR